MIQMTMALFLSLDNL